LVATGAKNGWVCFQQHPTQMDPAGDRTKLYWVMLEDDPTIMSPDAELKAILSSAETRIQL